MLQYRSTACRMPVRDHDHMRAALWRQFGMDALTIDPLMNSIHRLSVSVEALAALGAALRLQRRDVGTDLRVRVCLQEVLRAIDSQLVEGLGHRADCAGHLVETVFRQSADLLQNPERAPEWRHQDAAILQSQGQVSRLIIHGIDELAAQRPELRAILRGSGTFLDVGTGAGWLALEAARVWPTLQIVGIDIWEPALALARNNIAASEHGGRIELRSLAVERLDDRATYAVAWFPGSFISAETRDDERTYDSQHSAMIRKQLDWIAEDSHRIFARFGRSRRTCEPAAGHPHIRGMQTTGKLTCCWKRPAHRLRRQSNLLAAFARSSALMGTK